MVEEVRLLVVEEGRLVVVEGHLVGEEGRRLVGEEGRLQIQVVGAVVRAFLDSFVFFLLTKSKAN